MVRKLLLSNTLVLLLFAGSASAGSLALEHDHLDFGVVAQGEAVILGTVISNIGTETLENVSFELDSPDFAGVNCGTTLSPGASCLLRVQFAPTRKGAFIRYGTISYEQGGFSNKAKLRVEGYSNPF